MSTDPCWVFDNYNDAALLIDHLTARIAELESQLAGKWQPIETALKDASDILLYSDTYGVDVARFYRGKWRTTAGQCDIEYPTHWMPLPTPPSEGGK